MRNAETGAEGSLKAKGQSLKAEDEGSGAANLKTRMEDGKRSTLLRSFRGCLVRARRSLAPPFLVLKSTFLVDLF